MNLEQNTPKVNQETEPSMKIKEHSSLSILSRMNPHLTIQYAIIMLLGIMMVIQTLQIHSLSSDQTPRSTLTEQNKILLQLQEQQARQANDRLEAVLRHFQEVNERRVTTLEKHLEEIENKITSTTAAIQSTSTGQKEPFREIVERLSALEQAAALERESIRALGARQEERITALGMVMGELGTRLSQIPNPPTH